MNINNFKGNHSLLYFYGAELFLNILKALLLIASSVKLLQSTNSIAFFGLAMLVEAISSVFAPVYIGNLIDRKSAIFVYKKILFIIIFLLLLVWIAGLFAEKEGLYIFLVYSIVSFFSPLQRLSQQSYFSYLSASYNIKNVNAVHQMCVQFGQIFGLLLALFLVDNLEYSFLHLIAIGILFFSLFCVLRVNNVQNILDIKRKDINIGMLSAFNSLPKILSVVVVVSTFDYLIISIFNLSLSLISQGDARGHATTMAYFDISYALGSIVVSYFIARNIYISKHLVNVLFAYILIPLFFIALIQFQAFAVKMMVIFMIGMFVSLSSVAFNTYIQLNVPLETIGRILALRRIILSVLLFLVINYLSGLHYFAERFYGFGLMVTIGCFALIVLGVIVSVLRRGG